MNDPILESGDIWYWVDKAENYESALRLIADSYENTMSYPEDLYFRVVEIAKKALQEHGGQDD